MTDKPAPEDPFDAAVTEERLVPLPGGERGARTEPTGIAPLGERPVDPPLLDPYASRNARADKPREQVAPPAARSVPEKPERDGAPPPSLANTVPPRRWLKPTLVVLALLLSVVGFGITYVALNFQSLVRASVTDKARERGFGVRADQVDARGLLPWQSESPVVVLKGVKLTAEQNPELEIEADEITVKLGGTFPSFEPTSIEAKNAFINAPDVPSLAALEVSAKEGTLSKTPFTLKGVRVRVASLSAGLPVTVVARASEVAGAAGVLRFSDVTLELPIPFVDLKLGPASADVERAGKKTTVVFDELKAARFALDDEAKLATVDLEPLSSSVADKLLGTDLPEMLLSGSASLNVANKDALSGKFSVLLDGYVPPHPRELNGIVFGKKTQVSGSFHVVGKTIKLDDVAIAAGSFKLAGTGSLSLDNGGSMSLDLKGSVPCSELAASAVSSHLGMTAGLLTGGLASGHLGGTVSVRVTVEAKLTDIEHAQVSPSAYIGCRLSL